MDTSVMIFGTPDQMHAARSLIQAFVLSEPPAPWYSKSLKVMHPLLIFWSFGENIRSGDAVCMDNEASNLMCVEFINFTTVFRVAYAWNVNYAEQRQKFKLWKFSRFSENVVDSLPYEICKALWVAAKIYHFCARCSLELESFWTFCMRTHHLMLWTCMKRNNLWLCQWSLDL
jgi:hypothetical protein